jgi:hypothetical protein
MIKKINFTNVNPINNKENSLIKNEIYNIVKKKDFILGESVKKFEDSF